MSPIAEELEQRVQMALDRLDAEEELGRDLAVGGRRGERSSSSGAQRACSTRCCAGESAGGDPRWLVDVVCVLSGPATNTSCVRPTSIESPSSSRHRPRTRRPLTLEPLRESPSSTSVHAPPTRSSTACARETSVSHASGMSLADVAPDAQRRARELHDVLPGIAVEVEQERHAAPLGGEPLASSTGETDRRLGGSRFTASHYSVGATPGNADLVDLRILHGVAQPQRRGREQLVRGERARPASQEQDRVLEASSPDGRRPRRRDGRPLAAA